MLGILLSLGSGPVHATPGEELLLFESGLRVLVRAEPEARSVAMTTVIRAGSGHDPEGASEVAHALEHLWFRSGEPGVHQQTWQAGCETQAYTFVDHTEYIEHCPAPALPMLLEHAARRLQDPLQGVQEQDLAIEAQVVRAELEERADHPAKLVRRSVYELLYPAQHPVNARARRDVMELSQLSLAEIQDFAQSWYRPEHAAIAIVGPVDVQALRSQLVQTFGQLTPSLPRPDTLQAPAARRTLRLAHHETSADIEHPLLVLAWPLPEDQLSSIEQDLLARLVSILLYLRYDRDPDVLSSFCWVSSGGLTSPLVCTLELRDEAPLETYAGELKLLSAELPQKAYKKLLKSLAPVIQGQWLLDLERSMDHLVGASRSLAGWVAWGGGTGLEQVLRDYGTESSVKRVMQVAETQLDPAMALVVIFRPEPRERPRAAPVEAPAPLELPPIQGLELPGSEPPPMASRQLDNGLRVVAVQRPDAGLAYVGLQLRPEDAGRLRPADRLVVEHAGSATSEHLLENSLAWTGFAEGGLRHQLSSASPEQGLGDLQQLLSTRSVWLDDPAAQLALAREELQREQEHGDWWARRLSLAAQGLDASQVQDWLGSAWHPADRGAAGEALARWYRPEQGSLVLVSAMEPELALDVAAEGLGDLRAAGPSREIVEQPVRLEGGTWVVEDPRARRARVTLHWPAPEGPAARALLVDLLRELSWWPLRERSGLVYTPELRLLRDPDLVELAFSVDAERVPEALQQLEQALAAVDSERLELARARRLVLGTEAHLEPSELVLAALDWGPEVVGQMDPLLREVELSELGLEDLPRRWTLGVAGRGVPELPGERRLSMEQARAELESLATP